MLAKRAVDTKLYAREGVKSDCVSRRFALSSSSKTFSEKVALTEVLTASMTIRSSLEVMLPFRNAFSFWNRK